MAPGSVRFHPPEELDLFAELPVECLDLREAAAIHETADRVVVLLGEDPPVPPRELSKIKEGLVGQPGLGGAALSLVCKSDEAILVAREGSGYNALRPVGAHQDSGFHLS
jgi:hypothetical protein